MFFCTLYLSIFLELMKPEFLFFYFVIMNLLLLMHGSFSLSIPLYHHKSKGVSFIKNLNIMAISTFSANMMA